MNRRVIEAQELCTEVIASWFDYLADERSTEKADAYMRAVEHAEEVLGVRLMTLGVTSMAVNALLAAFKHQGTNDVRVGARAFREARANHLAEMCTRDLGDAWDEWLRMLGDEDL